MIKLHVEVTDFFVVLIVDVSSSHRPPRSSPPRLLPSFIFPILRIFSSTCFSYSPTSFHQFLLFLLPLLLLFFRLSFSFFCSFYSCHFLLLFLFAFSLVLYSYCYPHPLPFSSSCISSHPSVSYGNFLPKVAYLASRRESPPRLLGHDAAGRSAMTRQAVRRRE